MAPRIESVTFNVNGAPVPHQRMCADRSPQRRQRATVGWMGPGRGRGRGRVGCCGVSPTANKQDSVAVRMYTDWCCSSEHHRRARHAVQAFRRVHPASYHSEHLVLGDRLPRPAHVRIQLAVRDATLSGRWPAAAGACDRYDPSVACSPKTTNRARLSQDSPHLHRDRA